MTDAQVQIFLDYLAGSYYNILHTFVSSMLPIIAILGISLIVSFVTGLMLRFLDMMYSTVRRRFT